MPQFEETTTRDGQHVALVHDRLRDAILRGEIAGRRRRRRRPRSRKRARGRAARPLREALRMLQREGLVISEPNRRVRIAELSSDDAEELYVMRIALEAVAIRITVPTPDFGRLRRARGAHGADGPLHDASRTARACGPRTGRSTTCSWPAPGPRVTRRSTSSSTTRERYRLAYGATTPERLGPAPRRAPRDLRRRGGGRSRT